jgi:hypothetical protein
MNIAHGPRPSVTSKAALDAVAAIRFVFAAQTPPSASGSNETVTLFILKSQDLCPITASDPAFF